MADNDGLTEAERAELEQLRAEKAAREKLAGEFSTLEKKFNELTEKLSAQDSSTTHRPEATGSEGVVQADC